MSDYDELPFGEPTTPPTMAGEPTPRRHRHKWDDLTIEGKIGVIGEYCRLCGKEKDEVLSRRARNNRKRGNRIQAQRIVGLGGRNLAGNNPNLDGLGAMFAYESKSGGSFSDRYWRWLSGIPKRGNETGVLIITEAPGPGRKARSYVVVEYGQWKDLHGE